MRQHVITLTDFLSGKELRLELAPGEENVILVRRKQATFIEFADSLFRFNSGVLLPNETMPSADGVPHPGLDTVAACLRYAQAHPSKQVLITGHTDTVGSDEANVKLSRIRAQAVHGVLVGDRAEFAHAAWGPHLTDDQRYPNGGDGSKAGVLWSDYSDVLNWLAASFGWPCQCGYPGGPPWIYDATLKLQASYNASDIGNAAAKPLQKSGRFDEPTWGAVYDCYEVKLAELLEGELAQLAQLRAKLGFVSPANPYVGCGEFKPIDQVGRDNYRSQGNRRVEVLFFDPGEEPDVPCLQASCDPPTCILYDEAWFRRRPVPVNAQVWTAEWENAAEPVHSLSETRKMMLVAPDLPAGESVTFTVYQEAEGNRRELPDKLTVLSTAGYAEAPFGDWYRDGRSDYFVSLREWEPPATFPPVTFSFTASTGGADTASAPLRYSGTVASKLSNADGTVLEAAGQQRAHHPQHRGGHAGLRRRPVPKPDRAFSP